MTQASASGTQLMSARTCSQLAILLRMS